MLNSYKFLRKIELMNIKSHILLPDRCIGEVLYRSLFYFDGVSAFDAIEQFQNLLTTLANGKTIIDMHV